MIESLWITFAVLLVVDLIIAAMRVSMLNTRMPLLITLREKFPGEVDRTIKLLGNPRFRISLALVVVIIHYLILGVSIWIFLLYFGRAPALLAGLVMLALAGLILLMLEYALEGLVLPRAETWAARFSVFAGFLDFLLSPFSVVLMRLLGSPALLEQRLSPVTEDELKSWVEEGQPEGSLEQGERRMIYSIFHFGDTLAREIMIPRIDILALEVSTPMEDAIVALNKSGHSRVPVYGETIDNVIGLLYAKDLLRVRTGSQDLSSLSSLLRPPYFVPEAKKVDELLREMQARSVHMALVVDEYGGIAGLVTMEDIVEEIVGEIRDEYDQSEEQLFEQVSEDEYIFHGRIDLDAFNSVMGSNLPKDIADTLGGYIYSEIGRVPVGGERIVVENLVLTVEQVSGRRIRRVRALRQSTVSVNMEEKTNGSDG
ncbi:MAG: HlyC/CorC family transporter [Anaerolineaceae bacterium]|nr:HlyC/CorC family transporter [Anaerolineaceae bacterium]